MKPIRTLLAVAAVASLPSLAWAGGGVGVGVNLSFGFPGGVAVYSAPAYYPPPAVVYPPPAVVYPAPPVYYAPPRAVYYPPAPVYRPYYRAPVRHGPGYYYGPPAKAWHGHHGYYGR
jgi:hypothetical protein